MLFLLPVLGGGDGMSLLDGGGDGSMLEGGDGSSSEGGLGFRVRLLSGLSPSFVLLGGMLREVLRRAV